MIYICKSNDLLGPDLLMTKYRNVFSFICVERLREIRRFKGNVSIRVEYFIPKNSLLAEKYSV